MASGEKNDATTAIFFEVLAEGNVALIQKYSLTLVNVGGSTLMPNMGTKQEYKVGKEFYYCIDGEKALKLKRGKKSILKIFQDNGGEMEAYAKKNDLGFRKEKDMVALFDAYNNELMSKN